MDPFTIMIDDADPLIFSTGSWVQEFGDFYFNKTRSYTSVMGSTKVVHFIGTSITVWGWLQSYTDTPNAPPVSQYSMDGGQSYTYSPPSPAGNQYIKEAYYQSPELPMGEHVLTIKNMADNDIIHLDYYSIRGTSERKPELLLSDGSPTSLTLFGVSTSASSNSIIMMSNTITNTFVMAGTAAVGIPQNPSATSTRGDSIIQTIPVTIPSSHNNPTLSLTTSLVTNTLDPPIFTAITQPTTSSNSLSKKMIIILSTCGTLFTIALLLLGVVLLVRYKRRRHRQQLQAILNPYIYPQSPPGYLPLSSQIFASFFKSPNVAHKNRL